MECPSCHTPVDASQRFCPTCGTALSPAEPAQQDPMLGATLGGKYKVVRLLGEGGMGAVYEGEQQLGTTKRKVAVKTLHPHLSRDPKIKARFEREVGTIAELEHPNTIQVYDFGTTAEGILYIVMASRCRGCPRLSSRSRRPGSCWDARAPRSCRPRARSEP